MLYDYLRFSSEGDEEIAFNIQLPGRISVMSGDGGTGKTLFVNCLGKILDSIKLNGMSHPNISSNIKIFKYNTSHDELLNNISVIKEHLLILDNADLYLTWLCPAVDYINRDINNQYLIFYRGYVGLNVPRNHKGTFLNEGKTIYTKYRSDWSDEPNVICALRR